MKQREKSRIEKMKVKLAIICIVMTVIVSQMPMKSFVHAESDIADMTLVAGTNEVQTIQVENPKENIKRFTLMQNSEVIETKNIDGVLTFDVYTNGTYNLLGYDEQDVMVGEQSITVDTFEEMEVKEDPSTHQVTILSRHEDTYQIKVSGTSQKVIDAVEIKRGVYQAVFDAEKNGSYTFTAVDMDGKTLKEMALEITDIPKISKSGEIILSNEDDLKQIVSNPEGNFVLTQDIEVKGDPLKGVTFKGKLDGQDYVISCSDSLFEVLDHATIKNIVVKGRLANISRNSMLDGTGYYIEGNDTKQDYAVILNSENTTIQNSFVMMNVEGRNVAGFVLVGTGAIKNSYVSGYLSGETVYGFGKDTDVENSYSSASMSGEKRTLFSDGKRIGCFYDAQINDLEDADAQPYLSDEITSGTLHKEAFIEKKGSYPQIKTSIAFKEQAQKTADLSVVRVESESNLSAMTDSVRAPEQNEDDIKWNRNLVRSVNRDHEMNGEMIASVDDMQNRFMLRAAAASVSISAGKPTTSIETEITYPVKMGIYYIVQKSSDPAPESPKTHKAAIESGWKRMYWDGSYTLSGLEWNTTYTVYETDLNNIKVSNSIQTAYGKNKGKLSLSGDYDIGKTMTATLSDTNTMKGTLYWETADTSDAKAWTVVKTTAMNGTESTGTYNVTAEQSGKYLRARFETDSASGYTGTLQDISSHSVKVEISSIEIENKEAKTNGQYTLTDKLNVKLTPNKLNDATYAWYQEGKEEAIGTGMNYIIKGSDVGKKLYVKATAKADGELKGISESVHTTVIQSIQCERPKAEDMIAESTADDITVKVKISVSDGLYHIGIQKDGETGITEHGVSLRGGSDTTITGLEPNTTYKLYIKEIGEEGYTDSDWSSDSKAFTTDKRHVQGDTTITGDLIYGKTLTAKVTNTPAGQTGEVNWYRLNADGSRNETTKQTGNTYVLKKEDVDQKIELVYSGTETYAGEISFVSDEISRAEKDAPAQNLSITNYDDTTITVKMPTNTTGEQYIIGRSTMENGIPVEEVDSRGVVKILGSGESFMVTGLERDTDYYFSVRYAQSDTHQKSSWTAQSIIKSQKTNKKEFKGSITFSYPTSDLLRGQTLTAMLAPEDPGFNYQGEWTWTKKADNGTETPITNYTLAENRGSTSYVIPDNEAYGTTYKVTFKATVGYEGSVTPAISNPVKEKQKSKYTKPNANDIIMETVDDMSFKVRMSNGEGQYQFEYKKADTNAIDSLSGWFNVNVLGDSTDGYIPVGNPVKSNVDVVVEGLDRNTTYAVRVKRIEDNGGLASDYANSSDKSKDKTVTTAKTTITGYVTIDGTPRFNEELTASYHGATYASTGTGSDIEGTWQWYRGSEKISGSTSAKYTITAADIGKTLKAVYTMPSSHAFTGSVEELTTAVSKALPDMLQSGGPTLGFNSEKEDNSGNKILVLDALPYMQQYGYYCVQKKGTAEPSYPTTGELVNWTKVSGYTIEISRDYSGALLETNTAYVVYYLAPENTQYEKTAMKQLEHTMGTKQQKGDISITGNYVVGKTLTATLNSSNNIQGTWKWYSSNSTYNGSSVTTSPSLTDTSKWTELTEGYSPMSNSLTSQLTLTENLFGKYIKVEFVPNTEQGYSGTIVNPINNNGFVKKIYEETIILTSSTSDGNGNPKAYAGTILTATVNNSEETTLDRTTTKFKIGNSYVTGNVSGNKFTYTIPTTSTSTYTDGAEIIAEMSPPKILGLYVNKSLTSLSSANLNSKTGNGSTNTYFTYAQGIPISSAGDLYNFISAAGKYTDRSAKYIITKNIEMSTYSGFYTNKSDFTGTLNGEYHKLTKMTTPLLWTMQNDSVVENLIIQNSTVSTPSGTPAGTISVYEFGNSIIRNTFLIDSNLDSGHDAGYFIGLSFSGTPRIENSGAVGGIMRSSKVAGGFVGNGGALTISDSYLLGTDIKGNGTAGICAYDASRVVTKNMFLSVSIPSGANVMFSSNNTKGTNNFYDSTKMSNVSANNGGIAKSSRELTSGQLFGVNDTWVYSEGYYPRLKWIADDPFAKLYSATRGAFTSVDGKTSQDELFNGKVKGVIQLPEELTGEGFSVRISSDVAGNSAEWNDEHNTLTLGSNISVDLEVTYTDKDTGATASNTFTFEGDYGNHDNDGFIDDGYLYYNNAYVTSAGDTSEWEQAPYVGLDLWAYSTHASYEDNTYQWYRKKAGSALPEKITGATNWQYTVTKEDLGYQLTCFVAQKDDPNQRYLGQFAKYLQPVINDAFDNVKVIVSSPTESSATVKVNNGSSGYKYEYAYERADANAKIIVDGSYTYTQSVKIENLARNKQYRFYVRVAAGDSYEAGKWSPAVMMTTLKTNVTGSINLGKAVNNGSELTMSIDKLNGQTGTWKIERLAADTDTVTATISSNYSSNHSCSYTLQTADIGSRIRVTFTGSGDYQGYKTATTQVIKKTLTSLPSDQGGFTLVTATDTGLTVMTPNKTSEKIDVGYSTSTNGEIQRISADGGIAPGTNVTVSGLERNKTYYFSYRIAETTGAEASPWSTRTPLTTAQTAVKNTMAVSPSSTQKVDQTVVFTLTDTNKPTGTWILESTKSGRKITILPELYTVDSAKNTLSYKVQPKDAGGTLMVTFNGTKDFTGTATKITETISNASQNTMTDMPSGLNVTEVSDNSMKVSAKDGAVNYQFAYRKTGEGTWHLLNESVTAGTAVTIEGLERNTSYILAVRKSEKTGYDASNLKEMPTVSTEKTKLNGLVDYVMVDNGVETAPKIGVAEVNKTYKATYHKGNYSQTADDDKAGHWQWYAGDTPIEGETSATYKVAPMNGSPEISVRYIADGTSDFSGEVIGRVGTLTKPLYDAPSSLPAVIALAEDGDIRSKLQITNNGDIDAVYYYVQKASNQKVPKLIFASDADLHTSGEGTWFKASKDVTLTLDANTDYVVYLAKLEDGSHQASGVVSQRAVRTKKEDLSKIPTAKITETNADIWKVEETKEIRLTNHNEAPTGIWQYYVSPDKTNANSWINITAQIKASNTSKDGYTATTFSIPVKYNGYYVKAVFSGRSNYEGSQTYVSENALIGTQIKGHAEITAGDTSKVLVPINVSYVFAKEAGKDVIDEQSGQWTWYRVKDGNTSQIKNEDGTAYGKTGRSDSYTPGKEDVGAKIYAQYSSARNGIYSGSVKTSQLSPIERAPQNTPDAPTLKQVSGITVQMNLPANYRSDGTTIPETVLKYRKKGTTSWTLNAEGESWIGKGSDNLLKANTTYEVCAIYKVTSEYLQSGDSDITEVKTGSIPLEEKNLSITQNGVLEAGQTITAIYSGDGYDEGVFTIERSDGTVIKENQNGTKVGTSTSLLYASTTEDIGQRIIVRYSAKADAANYGGSVEKSSREVVKAKNTAAAIKPVMKTELDTNLYVTNVKDTQEYILLESGENIADKEESDWTPLNADSTGKYEFTHLKRNTSYMLYTRVAETEMYTAGTLIASSSAKTPSYNDAGSMEVLNRNDGSAARNESSEITFPHSLKKGTIKIDAMSIMKGSTVLHVQPISVFADKNGKATSITIEKGSKWANENFGLLIKVYDASGNLLVSGEAGDSMTMPDTAAKMTVEVYRANAVSDGGSYTWSLTLEDSEKETAVYQGTATMITQLKNLSPIKIDLNLKGQQITQSTNDAKVSNHLNYMPVTLSVDQKVTKGAGMPSLMGTMNIGLAQIKNDEAYLKLSNDGSDYNKHAGVWFTTAGTSKTQPIYDLGYKGSGGFYISGAVSKEQSWPWDDTGGTRKTDQAYQISFKTAISESDTKQYEDRAKE